GIGQNLAEKLDLPGSQGPALALVAPPGEEEARQLPHGVEAQAARHHRVGGEVTGKEPQIGVDIQFSHQLALAVFAAVVGDQGNAIEHQHIGGWRPGAVGAKQLAAAGGENVFLGVAALADEGFARGMMLWLVPGGGRGGYKMTDYS